MPISRAVSASWLVACMARPIRVLLTNHHSTAVQTASAPRVKIAEY
jgi:hypothetical protein